MAPDHFSKQGKTQTQNQNIQLWIEIVHQNYYKNRLLNMKIRKLVLTDHLFCLTHIASKTLPAENYQISRSTNHTQLSVKQKIMKNYRKSCLALFQYMIWQIPTAKTNAMSKDTRLIRN